MAHIFKPKKEMTDEVAEIVKYLRSRGAVINLSKFYEFASQRAMLARNNGADALLKEYRIFSRAA